VSFVVNAFASGDESLSTTKDTKVHTGRPKKKITTVGNYRK